MKKIRFRTKVKHFYNRISKYSKNKFNSIRTFNSFIHLLSDRFVADKFKSLDDYYRKNKIYIYEGYSTQSSQKKKKLIQYSKDSKNILEIGFNAGHSSEVFLTTNKSSTITSIDLGYWYYCKFGKAFLEKKYSNRINVIFDDSIKALSDYKYLNKNEKYDLIYIDGNHTYEYAKADLQNCKKFATSKTIILMDDVVFDEDKRTIGNRAPTKVWKELVNESFIKQIEVVYFEDIGRGIGVGSYI